MGGGEGKENKRVKILSNVLTGDIWTILSNFVRKDCAISTQETMSPEETGCE